MKALVKVGYGCNENCTFCHTAEIRHIDASSDEVHAKIRRAKALGHDMVVLSGGEPTIRPELLEWASHVASLDMDFGLVTNGLVLAYDTLVARLVERRLRYVYMSLHGGTPAVHNRLVRSDAHAHALSALKNLSGRGLDLTINAVITRQNLTDLRALVDVVLPYPDVTLKFSMLQPKGGGERLFNNLMPRVSEVAARVVDAIRYGLDRRVSAGPQFAHDGLPFCLLPGLEALYDDLKTHRFATMVEVGEPDFFPVDDKDKLKPQVCETCSLSGACPGLFRGYAAVHGATELQPVAPRPVPNSFNYVFESVLTDRFEGECPVLADGVTPWDRGRHVFVRNGQRVARFRTHTRDFNDDQVEHIKHQQGQIYLDVSQTVAPNDFGKDLLKLERSPVCEGCPKAPSCAGMFEPVWQDCFAAAEDSVRMLVERLEGEVLDVGCGAGVHEALFASLASAGRIRYVGLDPDADSLQRLRATRPWGEFRIGKAEQVDDLARFDHVLVLRSWNHLEDPERALVALCRALRPGGTLTLVDNEAYGLVRTVTQTDRAEQSSADFQHFRNHGAADAAALALELPLELVERWDVGRTTSNQWLLRYRKLDRSVRDPSSRTAMVGDKGGAERAPT